MLDDRFDAARAELEDIEIRMGEVSAYIAAVADALAFLPDDVHVLPAGSRIEPEPDDDFIRIAEDEWPTAAEIQELLDRRKLLREAIASGRGEQSEERIRPLRRQAGR